MLCFCPSDCVGFWFSVLMPSVAFGSTMIDPFPLASSPGPMAPKCLGRQRIDMPVPSLARCNALCRSSNEHGTLDMWCELSCSICGMCHNAMDRLRPYPPWRCWSSVGKYGLWNGGGWESCVPVWVSSHPKVALQCDVDTNRVELSHDLCVLSSSMSKLMAQSWARSKIMAKSKRMSKIEHINCCSGRQWRTELSRQRTSEKRKRPI